MVKWLEILKRMTKFHLIRFANIKYTSKSDKKISVTDRLTDICIPRAPFAAENVRQTPRFFSKSSSKKCLV